MSRVDSSKEPSQVLSQPALRPSGPSTTTHYPIASGSLPSNTSPNLWRPLYTPAPEGLLNFSPFPPMHHYNFTPPRMPYPDQGHQSMENLHYVGASPHDSFQTPPPPPQPKANKVASRSSSAKRKKPLINLDDDEPNERTARRLPYTPEEHVRLASAWLECSNDRISGNDKSGEKFWDEIAVVYNSTTPINRKRDRNQLKQEWQRTKKRLSSFHGEWIAVTGVYHSGYKPEDLEQMALQKYESNNGHAFPHLTMWVKLKDERKWLACYRNILEKEGKSASVETTSNVINLEGEQRPPGRDRAKAECAGKAKAREVSQDLGEKLDKFIEVNNQSTEERQKAMECQLLLSNRQLETAKIANNTKMLDVYQKLLLANTSEMTEVAKVEHDKALNKIGSMLFPKGDQGE